MVGQPQDELDRLGAAGVATQVLRDIAPALAAELEAQLEKQGEPLLAQRVRDLSVAETKLHRHGTDYWIEPRSAGGFGPGHRTLDLIAGVLIVDVVVDRIVLVEVLHRSFLKVA